MNVEVLFGCRVERSGHRGCGRGRWFSTVVAVHH